MKIAEFVKSAACLNDLAAKYIPGYADWYNIKVLGDRNITFQAPEELLDSLSDNTTDFPLELQFCWNPSCEEWHLCCETRVANVGLYKKMRRKEL